jgi:hypothetical protein
MPAKTPADKILADCKLAHNSFYDYSKSIIINKTTQIEIICPKHNISFWQTPKDHIGSNKRKPTGCTKCADERASENLSYPWNKFLERSNAIHKNKYIYFNDNYKNLSSEIDIFCPIHKNFKQIARYHVEGSECQECAKITRNSKTKLTFDELVERANKKFKGFYEYKYQDFDNIYSEINVLCHFHGYFKIIITNHIHSGIGCNKCSYAYHKDENEWLDYIGLPDDSNHRQVSIKIPDLKRPIRADGFDLKTQTIYEYYGDYYHGNPNVFDHTKINPTSNKLYGQLYLDTINRADAIKRAGYNLVFIWEKDWNLIKESIKQNETSRSSKPITKCG